MGTKLVATMVAVLVTLTEFGTASYVCPLDWYPYRGNCYKHNHVSKSWFGARDHCLEEGAHLVTIPDSQTQNVLSTKVLTGNYYRAWIGFNDLKTEGTYEWVNSNISASYTNWERDEPNGHTHESCAEIYQNSRSSWNDAYCNNMNSFVCQKPANYSRYSCPDDWLLKDKTCYKHFNRRDHWQDARQFCLRQNEGHLVTIPDEETQKFIATSLMVNQVRRAWIGLHDTTEEGEYYWTDSETPVKYTNWGRGEPSNARRSEDCGVFTTSNTWEDKDCTHYYSFICQSEAHFLCGEDLFGHSGNISSPNYPLAYPEQQQCQWTIKVPDGYVIQLQFEDQFDIEDSNDKQCNIDYVEVEDIKTGHRNRFCGQQAPHKMTAYSNKMVIRFHSDAFKAGKGFKASWQTICGGNAHGNNGVITSPDYPTQYANNLHCHWFVGVDKEKRIRLTFDFLFEVEDDGHCGSDYIEIVDVFGNGTKKTTSVLCGNKKPDTIFSLGPNVYVVFHTNANGSGSGFAINWNEVDACGRKQTGSSSGHIMSPNYPSLYPSDLHCLWQISPPAGTNITIKFDPVFDLEDNPDCAWDYIRVLRGKEVLGQWCHTNPPPPLSSAGQDLFVVFHSDRSNAGNGFYASWNVS